ncbi:MAG TPA: DUF3820 family protein [Gemmataceae bacterium]|nr:DUF3820 family protein [Gemmataceae bacterium]
MYRATARLSFGKHAGRLVSDVPTSYLQWLLANVHDLDSWIRHEAECTLRDRGDSTTPAKDAGKQSLPVVNVRAALKSWFASLCRDYHPDRTGDDGKVMAALNEANERLRKLLEVA